MPNISPEQRAEWRKLCAGLEGSIPERYLLQALDALDEAERDTKRIDKLETLCVTVHDADGKLVMFRAPKASPLRRYIDDVMAADAEEREGER